MAFNPNSNMKQRISAVYPDARDFPRFFHKNTYHSFPPYVETVEKLLISFIYHTFHVYKRQCVYNDGKASVDIHCFPLFHKIQDSTFPVSPFFPYGKLWKVEKLLYLSCLKHVFLWITYVCKLNPPKILQKTYPVRWKTESVFSFTFHKQIISIFST